MLLDQRHDDVAVVRRVLLADHDDVAVVDARVDHRVALDLQRVMLAAPVEHRAGNRDVARHLADRLDRHAGGDPAHDRQLPRVDPDFERLTGARPPAALDDARHEGRGTADVLGQAHDLDGAGAVREPADEAAFLQRGDQPVDAGLRAQVQRVLHLVERGRHAVALHRACG